MNVAEAVLAVYLAAAAITDLIYRKLKVSLLLCGLIPIAVSLAWRLTALSDPGGIVRELVLMSAGAAVGLIFLLLAHVTGEKIGKGDAFVFCICGTAAGIESLIPVVMLAFLLGAVYSAGMLATGRLGKKSRIAFVPFIFLGYVMSLAAGML
ncbi:MAG: A24 family peptidase [Lachnospiraceae bacterium]|nr:A24 family peptidase [Lachnospiraceae bacterium]